MKLWERPLTHLLFMVLLGLCDLSAQRAEVQMFGFYGQCAPPLLNWAPLLVSRLFFIFFLILFIYFYFLFLVF